jgi:RND superfamily putative drug exporter
MTTPREPALARLGRTMVRRRRAVVFAWVVILVLALVGGPKLAGDYSVDYSTPGSESKRADDLLKQEFPAVGGYTILITWTNPGGADEPVSTDRIEAVVKQLAAIPGVDSLPMDRANYSQDGKTGLLELPLNDLPPSIALSHGPELMKIVDAASAGPTRVRIGGLVISAAQVKPVPSEAIGISVALVILLLTFGTVVAAGLPVATALFGVGSGTAIVGLVAAVVDTPDWAASVAAMVGIGVGIDYALLILTRHRVPLRAGADPEDAVAHALATAGRSVVVAGGTVVISLLGLLVLGLPYLTGVAISASGGVLIVLLASITLLPALLGFAGPRIDALAVRIPRPRRRGTRRADAAATSDGAQPDLTSTEQSPLFTRTTLAVQRAPWVATVIGFVIVAVIASPITGVRLGFPGMGNDPPGSQTREASELLTEAFGPGVVGPMQLVIPVRHAATDMKKIFQLRAIMARDLRVAGVGPPVVSGNNRYVRMTVQPNTKPESAESEALLNDLRGGLFQASGLRVLVGGYTAQAHDQSRLTAGRLPLLFLGVGGLSALLLLAAFRSLLIPLKAALMNVVSIAAAYGVVALVAKGGTVGQFIGIDGAVPVPPFVPVLMFAVLFGLSMDYEVFLVGRMRELWLEHHDARRAVTEGVASTARVITAAAAIMIAVFGAFALSDQLILKLVGIGMASAILIDATIIRLLLVPALMELMGPRAWWLPGRLDRLVPEAQLEGSAGGDDLDGRRRRPVTPPPATRPVAGPSPLGDDA